MSKSSSPKRQIERRRSFIKTGLIGTSNIENILHTAEDAGTLVRIVIDGCWQGVGATGEVVGAWNIAIKPAGTAIVTPTTGETLDSVVPLQEIAGGGVVANSGSDIGNTNGVMIYRDIKAMRKLKKNDILVMNWIADTANSLTFAGQIYTWFKE